MSVCSSLSLHLMQIIATQSSEYESACKSLDPNMINPRYDLQSHYKSLHLTSWCTFFASSKPAALSGANRLRNMSDTLSVYASVLLCVCVCGGGSLFSPTPTHWHTQKQIPSYYVFVRTTLTLKSLKRTLLCRWCDLWPQHACVLNLLTTAYISRQSWKEADVRRRKNCESKLLASKSVIQTGIEVKHKETQLYLSVNRDVKNYCLDSVYRISCYPPRMNIYYIVAPVDYIIMCVSCSQSVWIMISQQTIHKMMSSTSDLELISYIGWGGWSSGCHFSARTFSFQIWVYTISHNIRYTCSTPLLSEFLQKTTPGATPVSSEQETKAVMNTGSWKLGNRWSEKTLPGLILDLFLLWRSDGRITV